MSTVHVEKRAAGAVRPRSVSCLVAKLGEGRGPRCTVVGVALAAAPPRERQTYVYKISIKETRACVVWVRARSLSRASATLRVAVT